MRHADLTELLQFTNNLCTAACHKMFFRTVYYLCRVLCDTDRSQIRQLYFLWIPSHPVTMLFENGHFMRVLFDSGGIEVIPIGITGHYTKGALLTTSANQQRKDTIDGGPYTILYCGL